jgi:hypothetical protein
MHEARVGEIKISLSILVWNLEENLDIHTILSVWMLTEMYVKPSGSGQNSVKSSRECSNESLDSIKGEEYFFSNLLFRGVSWSVSGLIS